MTTSRDDLVANLDITVDSVRDMLQKGDRAQLAAILSKARPLEVARVLVALDEPERNQASAILFDGSAEFAASVLAEMSPEDSTALLEKLDPAQIPQALSGMDIDQANSLASRLPGRIKLKRADLIEAPPQDDLRSAYIDRSPMFDSLRNYTGRDWLIAEIDSFLRENDRGYFLIEGKPGVGKTTFLAHLVKQRGYINHFAREGFGTGNAGTGLRNLIAQLHRAWGLENILTDRALMDGAIDQGAWHEFLYEAARRRDETKPDEKIVIVIDALDEKIMSPVHNPQGLPDRLPRGVYFILSSRPGGEPILTEAPQRLFVLEPESKENLADIRAYLERAFASENISRRLQAANIPIERLINALVKTSSGIWASATNTVSHIEQGKIFTTGLPADLDELIQKAADISTVMPDLGRYGEPDGPRQRYEEVRAGMSFGGAGTRTCTITALVTDRKTGKPLLLLPGNILEYGWIYFSPARQMAAIAATKSESWSMWFQTIKLLRARRGWMADESSRLLCLMADKLRASPLPKTIFASANLEASPAIQRVWFLYFSRLKYGPSN
jgi:flagellar motility protein MotE (MotC chaperone)